MNGVRNKEDITTKQGNLNNKNDFFFAGIF